MGHRPKERRQTGRRSVLFVSESVRPRLFMALVGWIVAALTLGLLDWLGLRWSDPYKVVVAANVLSPLAGALLWRHAPASCHEAVGRPWIGPLAWGLWAGLYYLVSATVAGRATLLSHHWAGAVHLTLPLVPWSVMVYLCVHPLSVLPFFGLRDPARFNRHLIGHLAIIAVSVAAWMLVPLTLPREALPPTAGSLGLWVLASMRGHDPPVNLLPSTHCAMAVYAAFALRHVHLWLGRGATGMAFAIAVSTLLTRQHDLMDVFSGVLLGAAVGARVHLRS